MLQGSPLRPLLLLEDDGLLLDLLLRQTVSPSPSTRSPVTLASLLPAVQEEASRKFSLAALVDAVAEADGRGPRPLLDPLGADLAGDSLKKDVGALVEPQTSMPGVGTDVRLFRCPPNPLVVSQRRHGDSVCSTLAGMDEHGFRQPPDEGGDFYMPTGTHGAFIARLTWWRAAC